MDCQRRGQLAVVIRYVIREENSWRCYEEPITIIDVYAEIMAYAKDEETKLTGRKIAAVLLRTAANLGLNLNNCVGQGYSGASALAGLRSGVASNFCSSQRMHIIFICTA